MRTRRTRNAITVGLGLCLAMTMARPAAAQLGRGLAIFDTSNQACVFEIASNVILGCFPFPGGSDGDCAITADGTLGVFTNFNDQLHYVDMAGIALIPGTTAIPNNGEDVSLTPGCGYAAVCDGSATEPAAVVKINGVLPGPVVSTLSVFGDCNSIDVCNDGKAIVTSAGGGTAVVNISATGILTDTGARGTYTQPNNGVCAPNSQCGVVLSRVGGPNIHSFTMPGLVPINSVSTGTFALSAVFNAAGTVLYVRDTGNVDAWAFDPLTCVIGANLWTQPATTMPTYYGMDGLALSPDQTKLFVTSGGTVDIRNPATGAIVMTMPPPTTLSGATGICVPDDCTFVPPVTGDLTLACAPGKACTDPGQCSATLSCNDGVAICRDSGGGPVTTTCTPTGPYANGTSVTVTCTNGTDTLTEVCEVEVIDAESPTCGAPAPTTVECSAPCGAPATDAAVAAWLASGTAGDNCPGAGISADAESCYAASCVGAEHVVTWIATDAGGYERSCASNLTVVDTVGPSVVDCALPAAPAPPGPASSGASSGAAGELWLVDCGAAADACSGTNVGATFVVTNTDENCLPVVEVVHVNCGDLVGIEILEAPSCPGSPPAAAAASSYYGAGCELVLSGESVELVVGATDACGNVGMCSTVFVPPPFTEEPTEVSLEVLPGSTSTASTSTRSVPLWSQSSQN